MVYHPTVLQSTAEQKKNINLLDCVRLFTVEEQLEKKEYWLVHFVFLYYACKENLIQNTPTTRESVWPERMLV